MTINHIEGQRRKKGVAFTIANEESVSLAMYGSSYIGFFGLIQF
jgi:hypothetical protein